jgi:hypothetical protein
MNAEKGGGMSARENAVRWPWFKVFRSEGFIGIRLRRIYITFRSSDHTPLFSERNRIRTSVIPLPKGWRIVARWDLRV